MEADFRITGECSPEDADLREEERFPDRTAVEEDDTVGVVLETGG